MEETNQNWMNDHRNKLVYINMVSSCSWTPLDELAGECQYTYIYRIQEDAEYVKGPQEHRFPVKVVDGFIKINLSAKAQRELGYACDPCPNTVICVPQFNGYSFASMAPETRCLDHICFQTKAGGKHEIAEYAYFIY